jgi:hypothetical protein
MKLLKVYLDPRTCTAVNILTDKNGTRVVEDDELEKGSIDKIEMFTSIKDFDQMRKRFFSHLN